MTNQIGYDRWEELREEVRASWLFRFDWWFRTRTAQVLIIHCYLLIINY